MATERAIWVVTDGRLGNENPARGLAEAVARRVSADVALKRIALRRGVSALPAAAWSAFGARAGGWPFTGLADRGAALRDAFDAAPPALAIGAGRKSAPIVAALRTATGGAVRAVQLMRPQMSLSAFDLVVAPAHDRLAGANVLETVGSLHRVRPEDPPPPDPRLEALERPVIGLLIGGSSRSARMTASDVDALVAAIRTLGALGHRFAATASPRTDPAMAAVLRDAIAESGGWFWDRTGENPYLALLATADALVVTADSVNMASEACATGRPVWIAPLSRLSAKLERFHAALRAGDHARPLSRGLERGALTEWRPRPLDDVARVADAVAGHLAR